LAWNVSYGRDLDRDYNNVSVGSGFSAPTFSFLGVDYTEVFTSDLSFTGGNADLAFTLVGSAAVPEPSAWAMMLLGFAGLSFAGYRASRRAVPIAS
jgi:hypothetical protein